MRSSSRTALIAVAAALVVSGAPAGSPVAHAQAAKPNIVFVMTDDQTASSIEVQRNVGLLRSQGTTFSQALVSFPLCCPSRATYLSGQYAHNHGVIHNAGPFGGYHRFNHANSLPVWLQQAGYRTMHVGRHLNGYGVQNLDMTEVPPGWDDWISVTGDAAESIFNYRRWRTNENGQIFWRPGPEVPGEHQTDFFGRRAVELIDAAAPSDQPFFLSLTFSAPHLGWPRDPDDPPGMGTPSPAPRHRDAFADRPLPRPPNFDLADVRRKPAIVADRPRLTPERIAAIQENYQQELESLLSVDEAVGALIEALRRNGEFDDTLFVYTSDNGFFHGEHRIASEKVLPYDASARVPLIVRGPGVPWGRTLPQLVANIDLAPTIVEAAGARAGRLMDGRSLFELLRDPDRETGREVVLENGGGANGVPPFRALRNERYAWIEHRRTGEHELYDMRRDPYELRNLAGLRAHAPLEAALARRLRALQRCRGVRACSSSRPRLRLAARPAPLRPRERGGRRPRRSAATGCLSGDVRLGLAGVDLDSVRRAIYFRGGRKLRGTGKPPFAIRVDRRALRRPRAVALRVLVITDDGRRATYDRVVRTCRR